MRKMVISLLLLMLCPAVHADAVSDAYKNGADTGKNNNGQGSGALSGSDPSAFIPGYTANPPEKGYYGGVQGGDGGIGDKGLSEFMNGDAGKAVTDSATKNPPVTLDPDADFIQNGKNAESNAGGMVDGTSTQCTQKVVSKTTFQNYSCERDVAVVQTCGRTGTPVASSRTTTRNTQLTLLLKGGSSNGSEVTWKITATTSGVISGGTISYDTPSNSGNHSGWDIVVSGLGGSAQLGYNSSKPYPVAAQKIEEGQVITITARTTASGHQGSFNDSIAEYTNSGRDILKIVLPMTESVTTVTTDVSWKEACGFDKSKAIAKKETVCTDPGGNRTVTSNGEKYTVHSDCWQYSDTYITSSTSTGNCGPLMSDKNCTRAKTSCTKNESGVCTHQSETWQCQKTYTSGGLLCGDDYFCKTGDCGGTDGAGDSGFDLAVAKLAGLASAGDDVKTGDQINIKAFTGQSMACRKAMAGFSNCCVDSGWGNGAGLANCSSEEMAIGKAKAKKVTVLVGEACAKKALGVCIQKKQVYCVFGGKLARIIQEQGRRDQLHVSFGSGDSPNCRGITVPELQGINFDKINFSDFYSDLMENQKIPDVDAMTKIAKDRIAAQVSQQTGGGK